MSRNHYSSYRLALQKALKDSRIAAGLRQEDVAMRLNQPQSFVSKYESGERKLDLAELRAICIVFNISLQDLIQRIEENENETSS